MIELGLLYDTGQHEKNAFEIMQINMNNNIIHNMFSHKVKITNGQIKYLLGVVVEVVSSGQEYCIELLLYELYHPQN